MTEREQVIENIRNAVAEGRFHDKVEINDPELDKEQTLKLLYKFLKHKQSPIYGVRNFIARRIADLYTFKMSKNIKVVGLEKISGVRDGAAIVTSNHFSPFENCIIRHLLSIEHKGQLVAVSQDTNFAMKGIRGFLLKYIDTVPLSKNREYMATFFLEQLKELVENKRWILMYPEQEMWFNYRKPRPCQRGAYFYAHKLNTPVVSCFVQIREDGDNLKYTLFVLDPILPDLSLSCKEDSLRMAAVDYYQKCEAYEKAYQRPLDYTFSEWDIASWGSTPSELPVFTAESELRFPEIFTTELAV